MKIILNKDYGGFTFPNELIQYFGKEYIDNCWENGTARTDKKIIKYLEKLNNKYDLEIIEIPDNSFYVIDEYDGIETIYYSKTEIKEK